MAHPVSPLAPKTYPELPGGRRRPLCHRRGRDQVQEPHRRAARRVRRGHDGCRCADHAANARRRRSTGAASICGAGKARGLLVNSGNANAFTGKKGVESVALSAAIASEALGVPAEEIFLASTGVIGEPLDAQKFAGVTGEMAGRLAAGPWMDAAKAIMTTDTFPKVATATVEFDGVPVTISGIAKGSGMIAPDMATMLSFVFTDAPIAAGVLQGLLQPAIDTSFNAVTVDSDTSTSDTCLVFATGKAAIAPIASAMDPRAAVFAEALGDVLHELAIHVVRDGEGATKMVTVTVEGATSDAQRLPHRAVDRQFAAGQDRHRRRGRQLGPHRHGRGQGRRAGRPRPARRSASATFASPPRASAIRPMTRSATSAYMKNEDIDIRVGLGLGSGQRPPSIPAT